MKELVILAIALASMFLEIRTEGKEILCYYGSWAHHRKGVAEISVSDLNPQLCTHIIYSFAGVTISGGVELLNSDIAIREGELAKAVALKDINSNLKVMLSIQDAKEGMYIFSRVVESPVLRATLIQNILELINHYKLDGVDFDWEFPAGKRGRPQDKENFVIFLKELRDAFLPKGYILSTAVCATKSQREAYYDVPGLNAYVDFINVMTYDIHGFWENVTGQNAPLYPSSVDTSTYLSVHTIVQQWIDAGASPSKLVLGLAFYGKSYTLANESNHYVGAPYSKRGLPGPFINMSGSMSYLEICWNIKYSDWTVVYDNQQQVPYAYKKDQWIGFDNVQSLEKKVDLAKNKGLRGVMIWSLEQDDVRNICGDGVWPLLTAVNKRLGLI